MRVAAWIIKLECTRLVEAPNLDVKEEQQLKEEKLFNIKLSRVPSV